MQCKWIWNIDTIPKINVFLWQLCHNALPVKSTLLRRGCNIDPRCPLFVDKVESTYHLFGGYPSTSRVWELAVQHRWIPSEMVWNFNQEWTQSFGKINKVCKPKVLQNLTFLLWSIWKARNTVIFKNDIFKPLSCIIKAKKASAEWRIQTCMSVEEYLKGHPFAPSHKHKLVNGNPLLLEPWKSILMDPYKILQLRVDT